MAIFHRHRYPSLWTPTRVPIEPVEIDYAHPLGRGIRGLFIPGVSRANLVTGRSVTMGGSPPIVASSIGPAVQLNGTNQYIDTNDSTVIDITIQEQTLYALFYPTASGSFPGLITKTTTYAQASTSGIVFDSAPRQMLGVCFAFGPLSASVTPLNVWSGLGSTNSAAAWTIYANGISVGSQAGHSAFGANSDTWKLGTYTTGGGYFPGLVGAAWFYNRALSAGEMAWLNAEPFVMLRPVARRIWSGPTGTYTGPTTGTLAVTQADQSLSATGGVTVGGTLSLTQAAQALSATGAVTVGGTLSVTQAPQTLAATGSITVGAVLSLIQASQILGGTAGVTVGGTLSANQAPQGLAATGSVVSGLAANLAVTEAPDTLAATGTVPLPPAGGQARVMMMA